MAMTKEEQKAASDRIMAKLGPLTAEEKAIQQGILKDTENYPKSDRDHRVCWVCGAHFKTVPGTLGTEELSAMQQFADHMGVHNPRPAKWAEAHQRIRAGMEKKSTEGRSI